MSLVSGEKGCYAFLWQIENLTHFERKKNVYLQSPSFNTHWKLELKRTIIKKNDYVCVRLRNDKSQQQEGERDCEVSLLDDDDTVFRNLKIFGAAVSEWTYKTCTDFVPMSEIVKRKNPLFPLTITLRVICRIWQQGMQSGQHLARTVFYNTEFIWNIERFNNCQKTTSKSFELACQHFTINLSKSGSFTKDRVVDVKTVQMDEEDLHYVRCQLHIVYADGREPDVLRDYSFIPETLKRSWSFPITLKEKRLLNDSLPLKCEFTIAMIKDWIGPVPKVLYPPLGTTLQTKNVQTEEDSTVTFQTLGKDLWRIHNDKKFCDVTLKSSNGMEFSAHKSILGARSTVFATMFEDKTLATVDLPDVDSRALSRMLIFIYADCSLDLHFNEACSLYVASLKYGLQTLHQKCLLIFKKEMTIAKACGALSSAFINENEVLKQCVWEFIWEHYEEVIGSDQWKYLEKNEPNLVIQVLRDMGLKKFKKSD